MSLKLDNVHTYYGLVHMLRGVSLEVAPGELVAILGRNGAGKTTTIKSVMGLAPPKEGKVFFKDEDITGLAPHLVARCGISYVPASRGIFSTLTAFENLKIFQKKGARWDAQGVFDLFPNLNSMKKRHGSTLSGGEQQMLAIGRALVTDPSVILLDEPSQGLAPQIIELVVDMLEKLKSEGLSIILVEQNLHLALDLADRVYILDQGEVVFHGVGGELRNDPDLTITYLGVSA
jgi:branched-chain amino acid transport system ATP-binding protein